MDGEPSQPATTSAQSHDNHPCLEITEVDGTVDDLICQNLSLLPQSTQQVLQACACMGDCIDHPALCTVFDGNISQVELALTTCLTAGFLTFEPNLGQYRFAHDRIRQAALSMIDNVNAATFHIGYQLWTKSTPLYLNTKMFAVTNYLNHGIQLMKDQGERYKAAEFNLEAGLKAMSLAAFPDSLSFLQAGIDFLNGGGGGGDDDYWKDQYDLSLNLFSVAADAALYNQNFDRVTELVEEVLVRARTTKDKLPAYVALINSLGQRGNMEAALQVGIDVSKQLVEPLPPKVTNLSILMEIIKTRVALRGRSNTALLILRPLQDEDRIAAMYVLTNLVTYTFQAASNYCPLIGARIVRLCLKYGLHKWCALGFVTFGFVMCALDRKEGYRLGTLALTMVDRYRGRELLPRVYFQFYGLIHHWRRPLEESLKPLEFASKVGMEIGDVENAIIASTFCVSHCLYHGKRPLAQVEDMLKELMRQMRLFRQDNTLQTTLPLHQYLHNLTGRAPVPKLLAGEIMPLYEKSKEGDSLLIPYSNYCFGTELAFMFGDSDLAANMLEKKRSLPFEPLSFFYYSKIRFKEALICVSLARRKDLLPGKKQNIFIAKAVWKQLKSWAKDCPENFYHKQRLVEAELKSLVVGVAAKKKQILLVRGLYDESINCALKEGFMEEAALANELVGDFMKLQNDHDLALRYWNEALSLYQRWGATEKVAQLSSRMM